jgi:hypothetical protein
MLKLVNTFPDFDQILCVNNVPNTANCLFGVNENDNVSNTSL